MWELSALTSRQRVSPLRSIFAYVLAALIAALLWIAVNPHSAYAADASWNSDEITYQDNTYSGPADAATVSALELPEGTAVYTYTDPASASDRKIHVVYFAPGADPNTANGANYRTYTYQGQNSFSSPSSPQAIGIDPKSISDESASSCQVDGGLGFFLCPLTQTLATWMDWVFDVLASFLEVRPIQTGEENAMFRAWSYMRTFANVAFVIAFLVIIYSQVSNFGISNYGIKKLLPRIVIAAVLVNVSYIICSIAIDLSNVLGYSIQNVFIGIRNSLVGAEGNTWDVFTWESVSSFVLSGTSATVGAGLVAIGAAETYGSAGAAALAILLPALVVLIVAVLVALLVMAARQALITILTILAPLAFVAYLLPNTEKWFEKWRSTFMTMLILFPAFSVIFGGSQLAGAVIIQNANSINLVILGMIVQVAPLIITPLLIKLSGSVVGRIAGMVNNPNKGIIDRTKNFAKDRAQNMKAKSMQSPAKPHQLVRRVGQRLDHNRRRREGWRNAHTAMADANWANTSDYRKIDEASKTASATKALGEELSNLNYNQLKAQDATIRQLDVDVRKVKLDTENAQVEADISNWETNHSTSIHDARMRSATLKEEVSRLHDDHEIDYAEFKTGKPLTTDVALQQRAMLNAERLSANALRKSAAQREQTEQFTKALVNNSSVIDGKTIQEYAGGINPSDGAQKAVATALSAQSKAFNESVDTAGSILVSKNFSDSVLNDIALDQYGGTDIMITPEMRLAAMRSISKGGNTKEIIRLTENLDINDSFLSQDIRQEIGGNILANSSRPKWIGAGVAGAIKSGEGIPPMGENRTDQWIVDAYTGNKLSSADLLVTHDNEYLLRIAEATKRRTGDFMAQPDRRAELLKQIRTALTDQRYRGRIGERKDTIKAIRDNLLMPGEKLGYTDD